MGREPPVEEWEQTFGADLVPQLVPTGQPCAVRQPSDVTWLPAGAYVALAGCIGRHGLQDLLIMPGAAWAYGRLRRRCVYTPLSVLGVGERAVGLWVQALPAPGILALLPLSEVAAIARQVNGTQGLVLVTGRTGRVPVRFDATADALVDAFVRRLRRRAAGDPAPVPAADVRAGIVARGRRHTFELADLRLDSADDVVTVGRYGRSGRRTCLLALAPPELVVVRFVRSASLLGRRSDWLYVPRRGIEAASFRPGLLLLRSAGLELGITLRSSQTAAAASAWLGQVLADHDHSGAGS
jgi:hypothetical protein